MSAAAARRRKQLMKKKNASESESSDPVSSRLNNLLSSSEASDESIAYEALQLAQSQVRRFVKSGDINQAANTAYEVSMTLLTKKQRMVSVSSQLLALFVEVLSEDEAECTSDHIQKIDSLNSAYVKALEEGYDKNDKEEIDRLNRVHLKFLKKCTSWSAKCGEIKHGSLKLHSLLGDLSWKLGRGDDDGLEESEKSDLTAESIAHLALAEEPSQILEKLKTLPEPTKGQEKMGRNGGTAALRDCLLTRAVIVFIALENLKDANVLLNSFVSEISHKRDMNTLAKSYMDKQDGFAPSHAMFCNMLLKTCEKDRAGPLYQWLLRSFGSDLAKLKPEVSAYTQKIGRIYFGIQPPPNMLNMMENMMSMMGGAGAAGNPMMGMMNPAMMGGMGRGGGF